MGRETRGGWSGLTGEGVLALLTLLYKVLHLGHHPQPVEAVFDLLQGVLSSQMAPEWVGAGQVHNGAHLVVWYHQEIARLSPLCAMAK